MNVQPEYGSSYATLREMLFSSADHPMAREMFPDGKGDLDDELRRYQMQRLSSRSASNRPTFTTIRCATACTELPRRH